MAVLDVIGIGALNLDFILPNSASVKLTEQFPGKEHEVFEKNTEKAVGTEQFKQVFDRISRRLPGQLRPSLGGSAYLTITTLAQADLGLRLGFVGVSGSTSPWLANNHLNAMLSRDINTEFVSRTAEPAGMCISVMQGGERSLITTPNANVGIARHLENRKDDLVDTLTNARIIHVTSLFDEASAALIGQILAEVKRANSLVRISFDPGYHWCKHPPRGMASLLSATDFLIVNYDEFGLLADRRRRDVAEPDLARAARILKRTGPTAALLVLKRWNGVTVYRRLRDSVDETHFKYGELPAAAIEDATGAGDVFAAGFLGALASRRLQGIVGTWFGLLLARTKLGSVGTPEDGFEGVVANFTTALDHRLRPRDLGTRVFLSHGRDPLWKHVREFLQDKLGAEVEAFESYPRHGKLVPREVRSMIERCGWAVFLMAGEDTVSSGSLSELRPRQNVVHELGMAQMVLPERRVIVMTEQDIAYPSNIQGYVRIPFTRNGFSSALVELASAFRSGGNDT